MHGKIDHDKIKDTLVNNGFYQINPHLVAGWFHKCGMVIYYTSNKQGICYMVRYKLDDHEVRNTTELNHILTGYKNKGIL